MPTSTPTIDEPVSTAKQVRGTPLSVLARIPWLNGDQQSSQDAATESLATTLTHFEYLLGEFGMSGESDTDSHASVLPTKANDAMSDSARAECSAPIPDSMQPAIESSPRRGFDWSELLLRLDTAVEPYTRAIVVLVLVAVGAFTMLLLRNAEAPLPPQSAPVPATARPLPEIGSSSPSLKPSITTPSATKKTLAEADDTNPTASGPVGVRIEREPPVATLRAGIRPVPSGLENESHEYPSTALLPPAGSRSTQLTEGENPTSTLK